MVISTIASQSIESTPSSQPLSIPSSRTLTPVSSVFVPGGGMRENQDETVVTSFVSKKLWHYEKFVTDRDIQLKYNVTDPSTICYNVIMGCNLSILVDKDVWWTTKASNWVYKALTNLRNSKMTALKSAFFGKSDFVIRTI